MPRQHSFFPLCLLKEVVFDQLEKLFGVLKMSSVHPLNTHKIFRKVNIGQTSDPFLMAKDIKRQNVGCAEV